MYVNETAVKVEAESKLMLKQRLLSEVSDLSTKAQKTHNNDSAMSCNVSSSKDVIHRASKPNVPLDSNILENTRSASNISIPKATEQKAVHVRPEPATDSHIIVLNSKASNNKQPSYNYPKPATSDFQIRDMNNTDSVFQNPTPLKQSKLTDSHKNNISSAAHINDTSPIAHINTIPLAAQKKSVSPTARISTLTLTDHHSTNTSPTKIMKNQNNQINEAIVKKPVLEWDYNEFEEEARSSEYELNEIDDRLGMDLKTGNNTIEDNLQHSLTVQKSDFENMRIIGQFNHGFIIVQLGNHLFIVDQHASDEKYTFETLQATTKFKPQPLIRPKLIHLPIHDEIIAIDQKEHLEANGFNFIIDNNSSSGNRISLTSFPVSKGIIFDESGK
jgi:DNA mismatch repair ATPase MutL